MNDLISRQAAIDVLDKIFPVDPMRNDYTQGITCGAALAKEYIKQLPSAQPEPCEDTISRKAAIDALKNERSDWNCDYNVPVDHCIDAIYSVPSAQPDCKPGYWIFKEGETAFWDVCSKCGEKTIYRMPHFNYCPYCGSRMEGE